MCRPPFSGSSTSASISSGGRWVTLSTGGTLPGWQLCYLLLPRHHSKLAIALCRYCDCTMSCRPRQVQSRLPAYPTSRAYSSITLLPSFLNSRAGWRRGCRQQLPSSAMRKPVHWEPKPEFRKCAEYPVAHSFSFWAANDNLVALDLHTLLFYATTCHACLVGIAHE